jgi:hypothetical protein
VGQDRFRIEVLVKLLEREILSAYQRELAVRELVKKCSIYGNGCIKRGRCAEGEKILAIAARYNVMDTAHG